MDKEQREQYHRSLEATLVEILELLEKHRLERDLSLRQASGQRELVDALLARQHKGEFQRRLSRMHPADIAFVLERLPTDERLELWSLVEAARLLGWGRNTLTRKIQELGMEPELRKGMRG